MIQLDFDMNGVFNMVIAQVIGVIILYYLWKTKN